MSGETKTAGDGVAKQDDTAEERDESLIETRDEDEGVEDEDEDLVILVGDDDTEHRYILILTVELEGREYGVLAPEEQVRGAEPEEFELSIFEIEPDEDGDQFIAIEDDETFEKVRAACAELLGLDEEGEAEADEDTEG